MNIVERLIEMVAPHACVVCGGEGAVLCAACVASLAPAPPRCYRCGTLDDEARTCQTCRSSSVLVSVWAAANYDGAAKAAVHALKFSRAQAAAADLARAVAARCDLAPCDFVVPVPTANARVRQRGYDQSRLMAAELARVLGVPSVSLLARVGNVRQVGSSGGVRREQLAGAFRPLKPYLIQHADVLLVDDVITTGATLEAAARVLKAAGARRVRAAVFARA